jgi:arylsulfatase B
LARLRQAGLEENTLVFFLSDNGGPTRELTSSNLPLRGEKGTMYEGGIRVPFIVQWKGMLPAGEVYEQPVTSLDILPTCLAAAGISLPKGLDGVDLTPSLTGKQKRRPHRVFYWRQGHKTALRTGDWKLVRMSRSNPAAWELYNLADDLEESRNLAARETERLDELKRLWQEWDEDMVEAAF